MSVDQWKYKFLYPFGNIAPITDVNKSTAKSVINEGNDG